MTSDAVPARLSVLEQVMADLARAQMRTQANLDQLAAEMRTFKDESRTEMRAFKDEMRGFKDESQAEMRAFKDEMRAFKDEQRAASLRTDERLGSISGEYANRMGTLVEDILAPSLPETFRQVFGPAAVEESGIRVRRRHRTDPGRNREFDAVAAGADVFLVAQVKSTLRPGDVAEFLVLLGEVRDFFPDWAANRRVAGALASFYVDPSLVVAGERQGLLVLGLRRGLAEVLNTPGFQPRFF